MVIEDIYYPRVKRAVAMTRRRLLDLLEMTIKDPSQWEQVRKRIFQCFGNNGLDGLVDDIYGIKKEDK